MDGAWTWATGPTHRLSWWMMVAVVAGGLAASGCEHRISLQEFLAMEQEAAQPVVPATQPADAQAAALAAIEEQFGPYKVGPGDVLSITLTGIDQTAIVPPVEARIDREGQVQLPAVGAVNVASLPLEDVEVAIHNAYVPKVYREVVVHATVADSEFTQVLVTGAAGLPGLVKLRRTERDLLHAIVMAGGISSDASGEVTMHRLREPETVVTLDLLKPEQLKKAMMLPPLDNGDMVMVRSATPNTVFVGGLVNAPRVQPYPAGVEVTVLQALAASGGLRTDVTPREATLIRRMPDGKDVHVKLDLDRVTTGRDPNVTLAEGDILWVPDTIETRAQDFFNRNFFFRAGFAANVNYNVSGIEYMNRRSQQSSRFGGSSQDSFDPFGYLTRNSLLQAIPTGN